MKLELPTGNSVLLEISHFPKRMRRRGKTVLQRATKIRVINEELKSYVAESVCSLQDQFNRKTGKEIAGDRLRQRERFIQDFTEEERNAILRAINPVLLLSAEERAKMKVKIKAKPKTKPETQGPLPEAVS